MYYAIIIKKCNSNNYFRVTCETNGEQRFSVYFIFCSQIEPAYGWSTRRQVNDLKCMRPSFFPALL